MWCVNEGKRHKGKEMHALFLFASFSHTLCGTTKNTHSRTTLSIFFSGVCLFNLIRFVLRFTLLFIHCKRSIKTKRIRIKINTKWTARTKKKKHAPQHISFLVLSFVLLSFVLLQWNRMKREKNKERKQRSTKRTKERKNRIK